MLSIAVHLWTMNPMRRLQLKKEFSLMTFSIFDQKCYHFVKPYRECDLREHFPHTWVSSKDNLFNSNFKGEGHSKKRILLSTFALSLVTHRSFSL